MKLPANQRTAAVAEEVAKALKAFVREHGDQNRVSAGELATYYIVGTITAMQVGRAAFGAVTLLRREGWRIDYTEVKGFKMFLIDYAPHPD